VVSLVAHLWQLGLRPLAHDEAIDAWFSWQAGNGDVMKYDPVYHGPLRFYLEGGVLQWFGDSAFWARLIAALCGVAATAIIASNTRLLGKVGAPVAALVFTFSPTVLTVTRTGREDSLTALLSLGLLLVVANSIERPSNRWLIAGGALLALSWATKESTFLFGFVALWFFLGALALAWRRPDGRCRAAVRRIGELGTGPWYLALATFLMLFTFVFTSFFRYAEGVESGFVDGLQYWWSQQPVARGGQPWYFYLTVYAAYEWLLLPLAAVGMVVVIRRRSVVGVWLITMCLGQMLIYGWAAEKFAWLAIHPLVPAVLLAGIGAEALWHRLRRPRALVFAFGGLLAVTAVVAWRPAVTDGSDPRELLVAVHTTTEVPQISEFLHDGVRDGSIDSILVDPTGGGTWPWAWYLHDLPVAYGGIDPSEMPGEYDVLILHADFQDPPDVPDGYVLRRFPMRAWWMPDYSTAGIGDLLSWFFTRDNWNPTGSFDQYLIVRESLLP